jgi:AhpD family alkylhydroperoxidase
MPEPRSSDPSTTASIFTPAVAELVAIAAAIGANCEPSFTYHYSQAHKLGVSADDMAKAVELAKMVKPAPSQSMLILADRLQKMLNLADKTLGTSPSTQTPMDPNPGSCCSSMATKAATPISHKNR